MPFAPYTPPPEAPGGGTGEGTGEGTGGGSDLETVSLPATYGGDGGQSGETKIGAASKAYGTLEQAVQAVGDTFVNPFTGQVELTQDAYSALLESDPEQMAANTMQQEMARLAAAKTAAMQQQKAQFAAAGLGASGAMSADIAGTGAAYAGQAATTALQIENQKMAELENWRKLKMTEGVALEDLKDAEKGAFGQEMQDARLEIGNYIDAAMADVTAQTAGAQLHRNLSMETMVDEAIALMEKNNVGFEEGMGILRQIVDAYTKAGIAFHAIHGKTGGYVYHSLDPSISWDDQATPGQAKGNYWYKGERPEGGGGNWANEWETDLTWD